MNSIQNNPMRYIQKGRRTAAALTENPARALVAVLEVLKLTCSFVRPFIGEGKREASRSARVLLDWTSKEIDEKIRDQASSHPYGMKFQNPHSRPLRACAKKRDDDENATSPPARARSHRVSRALSRAMRARFRRDGVKKYTPARSRRRRRRRRRWRIFRVCNPPFCLGAEKKRPSLQKKKRKNPLVVPRFLRRKALSLEVSRPKTRPRCGGKRVGAYLGGELRGSNGGRQRKHFCICGVFVDVFCA